MLIKLAKALPVLGLLIVIAQPARATLVSFSASGRISQNSTGETTIPVGTPWTFELIYNTAAPDLDFELTGTPDPTFGRFTNTGAVPALTFFHYRAGTYEVTIDEPADFGPFSEIHITFGGTHAIDINLNPVGLFPPLGGAAVTSFHVNFDDFSKMALTSDALPTDTSLRLDDFQSDGAVMLGTVGGGILHTSRQDMTALAIAIVPEPSSFALVIIGLGVLIRRRR